MAQGMSVDFDRKEVIHGSGACAALLMPHASVSSGATREGTRVTCLALQVHSQEKGVDSPANWERVVCPASHLRSEEELAKLGRSFRQNQERARGRVPERHSRQECNSWEQHSPTRCKSTISCKQACNNNKVQTGCVALCAVSFSVEPTWSVHGAEHAAGTAKKRRERRLRHFLRLQRQTVAMLLAETNHDAAPRGQTMARSGAWERGALHGDVLEEPTPRRSPARSSTTSTTRACRSSEARGLTVSPTAGRRSGCSGSPWSRSSILCRSSRFSTPLCRRWWTS